MLSALPLRRLRARPRVAGRILLGLLWVAWLAPSGPARAQPAFEELSAGVELYEESLPGPVRVWALRIDLSRPEVSLRATRPDERGPDSAGQTVSGFAQSVGAFAAINANYANYTAHQACGLAMGDGSLWGNQASYQPNQEDQRCDAVLLLGAEDNRAEMRSLAEHGERPEPWVDDAIAGKPWLLRDGAATDFGCQGDQPPFVCRRYARTAVALDGAGGLLWVVVEGGEGSLGMSLPELASLLQSLGAQDAFALDYSGASALYLAPRGGLANCPSDPGCAERSVLNHLALRVDPAAQWFAARLSVQAPDPAEAVAPGGPLERVVRYTNLGRRTWRATGENPLRLGATDPQGRASAFYDADTWLSPARAVAVEGEVPAGEEGTFRLVLRGAGQPGRYEEAFGPVALGAGPDGADLWLDAEAARWSILVDGPADADGDGVNETEDCDDQDPLVHPGAQERCNAKDDDCDGATDEGLQPGRPAQIVWALRGEGELRINGVTLDRNSTAQGLRSLDVELRPGANMVAVHAQRTEDSGAALVGLRTASPEVFPSNTRWQAATLAEDGWDLPAAASGSFGAARAVAYLGQEPWGEELQGWPADLERDGFVWIWSARPEEDDEVFLRRSVSEPSECNTGAPGPCERGQYRCDSGAVRCVPLVAVGERHETCNGEDDDCDGLTDEGLAGCATAEDAGPPLPDLGLDLASAELIYPPGSRGDGMGDSFAGQACGCSSAAESSGAPLGAWLLAVFRR